MLAGEGDIDVLDARDAEAGFATYVSHNPDIAVVDIALPGASGFELTRRILQYDAQARVVVFSMNDDPIFAARAIEAGAKAYVTKNDDPFLLLRALREVEAGGEFVIPKIARKISGETNAANPLEALSPRELEILRLLGQGRGLAEIAAETRVSYKTVANACAVMKRKLGARTPVELARIAMQQNLL